MVIDKNIKASIMNGRSNIAATKLSKSTVKILYVTNVSKIFGK